MQKLYIWLAPALVAILELLLMIAAGLLILFSSRSRASHGPPPAFHSLEGVFTRLSRRKTLSVVFVGLFVLGVRLALNPILGIPQPGAHDEFSYLLAADTFAHDRLTNPTHPMWIHFESFHIIERPSYMSMYPPAQGLVLTAGQIFGHPWIGQLLVTALMCSALCWMLQGWLPPPWALLGGMLAALRLGLLSYWMNGYWCASVVAFGGALVLGAWPRLRQRLRVQDSLLMGVGLVILANSRPYEGFVFGIPVAAAVLWWIIGRRRPAFHLSLNRVVFPLFVVLACGALATSYYYRRVTGDAFRMTYQINRATYSTVPYFLWQTPPPEPVYHHDVMRDFYRQMLKAFERDRTLSGYVRFAARKAAGAWQFYLGPLLTLPFLAFPWVVRQQKMRLPVAICAAMVLGVAAETWTLPHYFSPATGALYILLVQCIRQLWHWRPGGREIGPAWVRAIPVLACAMILLRVSTAAVHVQIELAWPRGNLERSGILRQMQREPGQQLLIVHYRPDHDPNVEWVYNDADIDHAKVVWARDMGIAGNQELLGYFRGRTVWLVEGDDPAPQAILYSP